MIDRQSEFGPAGASGQVCGDRLATPVPPAGEPGQDPIARYFREQFSGTDPGLLPMRPVPH